MPTTLCLEAGVGKLYQASVGATSAVADNSRGRTFRLFVVDRNTNMKFLVDSGADVSIVPASGKGGYPKNDFVLYAANGSIIPTYGVRTLNVDLGMRRQFQWPFVVAKVSKGILGADFLAHFQLLIDLKNRQLRDNVTGVKLTGEVATVSDCDIVSSLSCSQKFAELINKFPNLTVPNLIPADCKHNVKHYIHTSGKPVYSKARRLDAQKLRLAKEEFQFMLNNGIIRPSQSEWASPLHLVPKKDGTLRPCGDFRRLNDLTVPDRYPIPHIEDFQSMLYGKKYFSKIDLFKAYYQIPIVEEHKCKTTVITPFGLFEFNVMAPGLRNAPSSFQRFIHEVFAGLDFVFIFLDDGLIASSSEEEHRQHLELVFARLDKYGLRLNVAKSIFGVQELEFLGYKITPEGSTPLPEKVRVIREYKLPQTVQQLRQFLGMVNFYRGYLPKAAETQAILHEYLKGAKKKDNRIIPWTDEAISKFEQCKSDLANAAMLTYPCSDFPLALVSDASDLAVGSVVQQLEPQGWRPLAFFSKKLNSAQRSYSAYDRELLSMYLSVKHFKHFLEGRQFVIFTDHMPLVFAFKQRNEKASPRQQRQLQYISEFTTDIRHISGKQNIVADTLSRIEAVDVLDFDAVAEEQKEEPELEQLLKADTGLKLKLSPLPSGNKLWCDVSSNNIRPFIPKKFREAVFHLVHDRTHPGVRETVRQVCDKYVWSNVKKDVHRWAQACISCQRNKVTRHVKSPVGHYELPDERLADVHIDLVGPLPPSEGYSYLLTMIDRFTSWMEVVPISNITAETVAKAVYLHWVSRFGVPKRITSDQGRQFDSSLFKHFSALCGVKLYRTTPYHPQCNGKVERLHRTLKTALKAHNNRSWTEALPTVLLGLRAAFRPDYNASLAQMLYGKTIRLPGEFFEGGLQTFTDSDWVTELQERMRELKPVPVKHKSARTVFIFKNLYQCSHVFVRVDRIKKPLEPPYEGPFKVTGREEKYFRLLINGKEVSISVDRLKPAYILSEEDCDDDTPTLPMKTADQPGEDSPNVTSRTSSQSQEDTPSAATKTSGNEKHQDHLGTALTTKRSGRSVRWPRHLSKEIFI